MVLSRAFAAAALACLVTPASAQEKPPIIDQCYARVYDAAHLAKNPAQRVVAMTVKIDEFEDDPLVRISYRVAGDGAARVMHAAACARKTAAEPFACAPCRNDSCEPTAEKFKLVARGVDAIDIVNDRTGVTFLRGGGEGAPKEKLAPDPAHRLFRLSRVDASQCAAAFGE